MRAQGITSTGLQPPGWERVARLNPAGSESSVDVLVDRSEPGYVLLQLWERNRVDEHVVETAVRMTRAEAQYVAAVLLLFSLEGSRQ